MTVSSAVVWVSLRLTIHQSHYCQGDVCIKDKWWGHWWNLISQNLVTWKQVVSGVINYLIKWETVFFFCFVWDDEPGSIKVVIKLKLVWCCLCVSPFLKSLYFYSTYFLFWTTQVFDANKTTQKKHFILVSPIISWPLDVEPLSSRINQIYAVPYVENVFTSHSLLMLSLTWLRLAAFPLGQ